MTPDDLFTHSASWTARPTDVDLAALPAKPAVFLVHDAAGAPVQLMSSQSLRRSLHARLIDAAESAGRADLGEIVRGVRWRPVQSSFEARWWHWRAARIHHPRDYRTRIAFGPSYYLHLDPALPIPEIRVTEYIWRDPGEYLGPWPARSMAQQTLESLWDYFDLCRYPEQVRKAPHGTRCAYADMGRCDAPCDGAVPLSPYRERTAAAWRFAAGDRAEFLAAANARMKQAASELQFEKAKQIKEQIDALQRRPVAQVSAPRRDTRMCCLLAIPAPGARRWKLFCFNGGNLFDGPDARRKDLPQSAVNWFASLPMPDRASEQRDMKQTPMLDAVARAEQTWLVHHFLTHNDAQRAVIVPHESLTSADSLHAAITDQLDRLTREPPAPEPEIIDPPSTPRSDATSNP